MGLTTLAQRLQADLVAAMKAGEKHRVETLRGLGSDLKYRKIELGEELAESEVEAVLRKAAKKRREAIEVYRQGGREDLSAQEQDELELILAYLPAEMSDAELDRTIRAVIVETEAATAGDVGRVMKQVMPQVKGKASGDRVRSRALALLHSGN